MTARTDAARPAAAREPGSSGAGARLRAEALAVRLGVRQALDGVDLALEPGRFVAVVGPNGAGKSTLLRALAGLLAPAHGGVSLDGRPLAEWPARERARRIAWLGQSLDAPTELTARDVVALGRLPHLGLLGAPGALDESLVDRAMADTECAALAGRPLAELSGGERQRVLLARALAVDAPVLLLDEPTAHLDPPHQVAVVRRLRAAARAGRAVAAVLHDLALALAADELLVLHGGRVRAQGAPADPAVREAVAEVFGRAIRIERVDDGWAVLPRWG